MRGFVRSCLRHCACVCVCVCGVGVASSQALFEAGGIDFDDFVPLTCVLLEHFPCADLG